ncbi:Hypothetical protein SCLAV_4958 [Streptomyces clavuligerus]|uniref:Uncharacterized protein n=1 Tax=Streptomyces clavuligerus TaxID=1901 RepID=E2PW41_STRCL|nr:Hypothetical protein SCLAV_4958 [Streptomyces clavuligerus]
MGSTARTAPNGQRDSADRDGSAAGTEPAGRTGPDGRRQRGDGTPGP